MEAAGRRAAGRRRCGPWLSGGDEAARLVEAAPRQARQERGGAAGGPWAGGGVPRCLARCFFFLVMCGDVVND